MRLYLQDKNMLVKFNLPATVDGSMLFSYRSSVTGLDNSINVDAVDGKWFMKSNGSVNIAGSGNTVSPEIELNDYMCISSSESRDREPINIFCLPSIEENKYGYVLGNLTSIKIGSSADNNIIYRQNLMREHHAEIKFNGKVWMISPAVEDSKLYVYVNNQRVLGPTPLTTGDIIFMNGLRIIWMGKFLIIPMANTLFSVNGLAMFENESLTYNNTKFTPTSEIDSNLVLYNENELFSHTPRIRSTLEEIEIKIDAPPEKARQAEDMPFLLSIGSSFTMLGMMALQVFNLYDGISTGEKDYIDMLPQMIMIVAMIVGSFCVPFFTKKWQKKLEVRKEKERQAKYGEYLAKKSEEVQAKMRKQEQVVFENHLDVQTCIQIIQKRNRQLWCRTIKDDDFIEIRLGMGNRPSMITFKAPEEKFSLEDDNLLQKVYELQNKYDKLVNVPITISLKSQVVTSFILQSPTSDDFINGVMLQLLALHSPLDLKIVVLTDEKNKHKWNYLKYTNHNLSGDFETRFFATCLDDYKSLCQYLDAEFMDRKEKKAAREKEADEMNKDKLQEYELFESYYLVITDCFKTTRNYKFIQDILENQFNYGFSLLIIDQNMKNLPIECKKFVVINDNESGMFDDKVNDENVSKFKAETTTGLNMRAIGRIVGNIPIQGKNAESQLPQSLSFLQMYNVGKIEQLNIRSRWEKSDPMSTLQAPIGVHKNGEIFTLDLHEKHDGPHGLIAGSTGSGKSEFIISYVLSMAINYSPKEVQFVLIDYKGGGLAGAFENREMGIAIPHLAGTITNLDTAEMNRTLVSIESELKRRQRKFNEVKEHVGESTMDIYKYQRLYREGIIDEPISHLFIVSDEFAELKAQQPDFMNQLVSTARIGRSLGVHLILATQKPSGVVNDQIWSNSKFKVCLKVQTKADSMEMLKRPEAASIKETGRFYLQVGYDEYFDIGQSAWSGDKYVPVERIIKKLDDSISFVDNFGNVYKRTMDAPKQETKEDLGDQLTNIVRYLNKIAQDDHFQPNKLWLPSLRKTIMYDDLLKQYKVDNKVENIEVKVVIGEYDAPANQEQGLLSIDFLKDGNLLVYGVPGAGKENIISTIIYGLSQKLPPERINFYIGDFGSETLKIMSKIPHVGDTFITEDTQKLDNMIKMLNKELARRKKDYSEFGGNYFEYCKLSKNIDPFIIVALNNYENFIENYPKISDIFVSLFRDGFKYGICFIVTTALQTAVRTRVAQNFGNKICLKMPNDNDYRDLLGSPKGLVPVDNYGRGIISINGEVAHEFQTADMCDRDVKTQFVKEYGAKLTEKYPNSKVRKIPILPDTVYVDDVFFEYKGLNCVPIGIEKNSLEVYVYDFMEQKINLIAAKSIKNHIYFVYALIKQMISQKEVKVHVIDALSIYRAEYKGVEVFNDNLEGAFVSMYNNIGKDSTSKEKNVYIILGISNFRKEVQNKYKKHFEILFSKAKNCKNNTFLFLDDSDAYKTIQVEDWFRDNINNTFGIWLGEDIGIQVALGVMSLSMEDRNNVFPCIGYPIYQGNHMVIKYVVDGVDRKNEE